MIMEEQPHQMTHEEYLECTTPYKPLFENCGPLDINKIFSLLGPPPVLSNEDPEIYKGMLLHYMNALTPRDFLLQMLIKDLVDADWEALRIKRHKAWAIERKKRILLEMEDRHNATAEGKRLASEDEGPKTEPEKLLDLEMTVDEYSHKALRTVTDLKKPTRDTELSRAMEEAINYYERLDKLEKDSIAKRVIILEQIRLHEEALRLKDDRLYGDPNEVNRLKTIIREMRDGRR